MNLSVRQTAEDVAERMRSLATPARLQILGHLIAGEQSVGDLERLTQLKQPGLSQQLAELRAAGWVSTRRSARNIVYSLADDRVGALVGSLARLFDASLDAAALPMRPAASADAPSPSQAAVFARVGKAA
ncbi:metalloregulator ArsR/SmtB family transcription factor [Caulobacter segnis]|uniref:ArsR/SmtB family transcription factor n=1 Tax=Caulobacter segnis TaxID=88688 RepID=UPI0024109A12|nr:metalloregulator ArsR/SmtB family transcription factor [Caulobacter segnis]MDG2522931.1 metalloregulator ArsR/SmtB family transcription factor [Caulobacter segnis]